MRSLIHLLAALAAICVVSVTIPALAAASVRVVAITASASGDALCEAPPAKRLVVASCMKTAKVGVEAPCPTVYGIMPQAVGSTLAASRDPSQASRHGASSEVWHDQLLPPPRRG